MKQRKEPMELPLLEIFFLPGDPQPVSVILPGDFEVTGEISISLGATLDQVEELNRLLITAQNAVADELWERRKRLEPPFKPTGRIAPKSDPSE